MHRDGIVIDVAEQPREQDRIAGGHGKEYRATLGLSAGLHGCRRRRQPDQRHCAVCNVLHDLIDRQ